VNIVFFGLNHTALKVVGTESKDTKVATAKWKSNPRSRAAHLLVHSGWPEIRRSLANGSFPGRKGCIQTIQTKQIPSLKQVSPMHPKMLDKQLAFL
jgi:hypothetical protein